jgi:tRNA 2-thiouridine synthesizing protein E
MPRRTLPGREIEIDDSGFLVDSLAWTPEIAEQMARESGLEELSPRHWRVLLCCREAAARARHSPDLGTVVRLAGLPILELHRLFRQRPFELMTKLAGLPKPPQCNHEP